MFLYVNGRNNDPQRERERMRVSSDIQRNF